MKQEIAIEWVNALRSGAYQQGQGSLRSNAGDKFCCLGVLCDLYVKSLGIDWTHDSGDETIRRSFPRYSLYGSSAYLPAAVQEWSGVGSGSGHLFLNGKQISLATMNDEGLSFTQIADVIEQYQEDL